MENDPGMPFYPVPDFFMRMWGILRNEKMQVFLLVRLTFTRLDDCEKFFMGLLLVTRTSHAARGNLECGEQGICPVSFIIMRDGATASFLEWQAGLGAI